MIAYPSFVQRLRGVATLADAAYEMVIYNVESAARRDGYLSTLPVTWRLDGLIIMALPFGDDAAQRLRAHDLETVMIEYAHPFFSSVEIDDVAGGEMVTRYLIVRGHRGFGFIGDSEVPDYAIYTSEKRLVGYQRILAEAGFGLSPEYLRLGRHGLPPTAIFAPSDTQAMGVLRAARDRGVAVPSDLAVVGFDDVEVADYIGLTTVRQPLEESGHVAVDLLLARLVNHARPVQHVTLPLEIVTRETT